MTMWVDATRPRRQLQALQVSGHSWEVIGRELGVTGRGVARHLYRPRINLFARDLIDDLYRKYATIPGRSPETTRQARARLWLPRDAWWHGDITSLHRLAEVTALLGWLEYGEDDPLLPLIELVRRFDTLPVAAQQITIRRGRGLYRAGCQHPVVRRCEQLRWHHRPIRLREGITAA